MIATRIESSEVLYPKDEIVFVSIKDLEELKHQAILNQRQRIRLCTHNSSDSVLHEMFIIHTNKCYVRPHKHIGKAESMTVLEGEVDILLFNDDGTIKNIVKMGDMSSGKIFYYRISDPIYHMLLIRTKFLVFHEVTQGPFLREQTIFPEWAPKEGDSNLDTFIKQLESLINSKI
jgi:cupin fold WbuC family metalloprotein